MGSTVPVLMFLLLLLGPAVPEETWAGHGRYSLGFFYTGVSQPLEGAPRFRAIALLNDQPFFHYNSLSRRAEPLGEWAQLEGLEDWDQESRLQGEREDFFMLTLKDIVDYYKAQADPHTFQGMFGCELHNDSSTSAFWKYSYDGRDFIEFSLDATAWQPRDPAAVETKQRWEAEPEYPQRAKTYLQQECPALLRKYLQRGHHLLDRRDKPAIYVRSRTNLKGNTTLKCQAYSFYPPEMELRWIQMGDEEKPGPLGVVLPSGDGKYQSTATVVVPAGDKTPYGCSLIHSSMNDTGRLVWRRLS